jgi:hypothetical protein
MGNHHTCTIIIETNLQRPIKVKKINWGLEEWKYKWGHEFREKMMETMRERGMIDLTKKGK